MLKQSKAEMDSVNRAKNDAVKRFDGELERYQRTITRLERDVEEFDKAKRASAKSEPDKPGAARKRPPAKS
jgi:hypothetical protein